MKDFDYELPRLRKILCIKKIRKIANLSDFLQRYWATFSVKLEELKKSNVKTCSYNIMQNVNANLT